VSPRETYRGGVRSNFGEIQGKESLHRVRHQAFIIGIKQGRIDRDAWGGGGGGGGWVLGGSESHRTVARLWLIGDGY